MGRHGLVGENPEPACRKKKERDQNDPSLRMCTPFLKNSMNLEFPLPLEIEKIFE